MHLESRNLAPGAVNLRLGAVRRLAYEAADSGLLGADSAAGIRRVKGVKKLGVRLGNPGRECGMVFGMATRKITITIGDDQIHEIRALVAAGQARNVSAFVQHAVGVALSDAAGWKEMLEQALQQTGGPLTAKERAWADTLLSTRQEKKRSNKGKAA
jgi:Arc/MetJ-type ribon-helix-helix transcriptional regulator